MKKVLMIVQNNFVNDARIIKEANTLGQNGYEVKVFALHDKGLKEKERFPFFDVERVYLATRNKLSKKNRYLQIIKYLEWYKKCIKKAVDFAPDVVHCHDLSALPIGVKIKKLCKCKLIYDSHELWSDASANKQYPLMLIKAKHALEKKGIKKANAVITVCDSIANKLQEQFYLEKKPTVIRNIPLRKQIQYKHNLFREKFDIKPDEKIILYQGAVQKGRSIEKIIQAMSHIHNNIVFVVLGNGTLVEALKQLARKLRLEKRVFFHEAVSNQVLLNYTNSADLGISLIENYCLSYYYALPNKMFEFIQANIPVLCSDFPEMKNIIENFGVGEVVNPEDPLAIANVINSMITDKNKYNNYVNNCIRAKEVLNWENEEMKLLKFYEDLYK